jgi:hypothetical protein
MDTVNIIISSKNRISNDTNSSVSVKLDTDILIQPDEECYVNMTSFNMVKSFYASQNGLNNYFQVIFRLPNEQVAIETFNIYLGEGNYNVNTLRDEIKKQTNNALFDITYDSKLNKYLYKNLFQPTFEIYIKPITAGVFLGFENSVEYKILATGTYSSKFINVSGYTHMIIKMEGEINIDNTISNIYSQIYQIDKVLGIFSLTDVAPMSTIKYDNQDGGANFRYKIINDKIPKFTIKIVNENGDAFPQFTDWVMSLRFEKVKKSKYNEKLANIEEMIADLNYYIKSLYSFIDIPSRLTLEDLQYR